jgi:hypothetical protein
MVGRANAAIPAAPARSSRRVRLPEAAKVALEWAEGKGLGIGELLRERCGGDGIRWDLVGA